MVEPQRTLFRSKITDSLIELTNPEHVALYRESPSMEDVTADKFFEEKFIREQKLYQNKSEKRPPKTGRRF